VRAGVAGPRVRAAQPHAGQHRAPIDEDTLAGQLVELLVIRRSSNAEPLGACRLGHLRTKQVDQSALIDR
jgi:hypothetical protein